MREGDFILVCARKIEDKAIFKSFLETKYFSSFYSFVICMLSTGIQVSLR